MRGAWILVSVLALVGGTAAATPLKVRNGSTVRLAIAGKHEAGFGLRQRGGGWKLELTAAPEDVADVVDVTQGANGTRWTVDVRDGALFFDVERFIAGHAYRVSLRHGTEARGTGLVYLYPPPAKSGKQKVTFDDEAPADGAQGDDEIATIKKPSL